jgi:hypothetical protein
MTAQMTEWYPPEIKPVRVGMYDTLTSFRQLMWWNGIAWCVGDAAQSAWMQDRHWSGLAADPAVTK